MLYGRGVSLLPVRVLPVIPSSLPGFLALERPSGLKECLGIQSPGSRSRNILGFPRGVPVSYSSRCGEFSVLHGVARGGF